MFDARALALMKMQGDEFRQWDDGIPEGVESFWLRVERMPRALGRHGPRGASARDAHSSPDRRGRSEGYCPRLGVGLGLPLRATRFGYTFLVRASRHEQDRFARETSSPQVGCYKGAVESRSDDSSRAQAVRRTETRAFWLYFAPRLSGRTQAVEGLWHVVCGAQDAGICKALAKGKAEKVN